MSDAFSPSNFPSALFTFAHASFKTPKAVITAGGIVS
jgi:hypothetical protein